MLAAVSVGRAVRGVTARAGPAPGVGCGALRRQLGDDRRPGLVFRALRSAAPARPPLVARDRGAVLPAVAVPAPGDDLAPAQSTADGARHTGSGRCRCGRWPTSTTRVDSTRVYEGTDTRAFRAPDRLRAGHGLAAAAGRSCPAPSAEALDASRPRRPGRIIAPLVWGRTRLLPVPYGSVSLATAAVVAAVVIPQFARRRSRVRPAALDRRPLVRHLPVALAHRRPPAEPERLRSRVGGGRGGGHLRGGRPVLALHRGTCSAGRTRAAGAPHATAAPWIGARRHALVLSSAAAAALLVCALGLSGMLPAAPAGGSAATGRARQSARSRPPPRRRLAAASARPRPRDVVPSVVYIGGLDPGWRDHRRVHPKPRCAASAAGQGRREEDLPRNRRREIDRRDVHELPEPRPSPSSTSPAASRLLDSRARNAGRRQRVRRRNRLQPGSAG